MLAATVGPKQNLSSKCQTFFCSGYLLAALSLLVLSLLLALLLLLTLLLLFSCILKVWHFLFDLISFFFYFSPQFCLFYLTIFSSRYSLVQVCLYMYFTGVESIACLWFSQLTLDPLLLQIKEKGLSLGLECCMIRVYFSKFRFNFICIQIHPKHSISTLNFVCTWWRAWLDLLLYFFWCASFLFLLHSLCIFAINFNIELEAKLESSTNSQKFLTITSSVCHIHCHPHVK